MEALNQSPKTLNKAVKMLKSGGVIICPTDTVYGFLADAANKKAVEKVYKIKKKPKDKPLPVFVSGMKMVSDLAEVNEKQAKIFAKFWPGKYTFILKRKAKSEKLKIFGVKKDTIALRIPKHSFLQKLLKKINRPMVQTSVNVSTQGPLKTTKQITATFGKNRLVALIIDGGDAWDIKPSKIIDLKVKTEGVLTRIR